MVSLEMQSAVSPSSASTKRTAVLDANEREHTGSYYAASQKDKAPFPTLNGRDDAQVCVIGGGFTGVATAVELAERGYSVILLESNRVGWGASGRNGGQIIGGYGGPLSGDPERADRMLGAGAGEMIDAMGLECVDIIRERIAKYSIDCDLQWGFLNVALKKREMKDLREYHTSLVNARYPHKLRLLTANEVNEYLGTDRYIGGLADDGWGHIQPLDLCKGEARIAERLGARIYEQSLVTDIEFGDRVKISTDAGVVTADTAVLCGNAYLAKFAPKLAPKLSRYILPATSYIIATEPLSDNLAKSVMPQNYAVCDQRTALDYFRLSADNRMLFGGVSNYTAKPPRSLTNLMRQKMAHVFPQLADVRVDYHWGGYMGIGINRIPQLGQLSGNVYYSQAYGGHGVAPTHMSARLIAEKISGEGKRFDLMAKVNHFPYPGFGFMRQSMFAAGMSFYKLRDAIT
ncbi:MAG: FAD-binding oxidoreductase [Pseudomonadota bacterium]